MAASVTLGLVGLAAVAVLGRAAFRPPPRSSSLPSGPGPALLAQPVGTAQRADSDASHAASPTSDAAYPPPVAAATPTPLPGGLLLPPAGLVSDTVTISASPRSMCLSPIAQAFASRDVTPMLDLIGNNVQYGEPNRHFTKMEAAAVIQGFFDAGSQPVLAGYLDGLELTVYSTGWVGPVAVPTAVTPVPTLSSKNWDGPIYPPRAFFGGTGPEVAAWSIAAGRPGRTRCRLLSFSFGMDYSWDVREVAAANQQDYELDVLNHSALWRLEPAVYHRIVP